MNMELTKYCKQDASQKEQFTSDGNQQTYIVSDTATRTVTVSDSSQMLGGGGRDRELAGLIPEEHQ